MRPTLAAALFAPLAAAAGCLSAPTGIDPADVDAAILTWPPPGADIAAIAVGDLDGNGKDDVVVADVNNHTISVLRGGADIDPTRATVDTASITTPLTGLRGPVAVTVTQFESARFVLVLDSPTTGPRLTIFDMALHQTGTTTLPGPLPLPDDTVTINRSGFGIDGASVFMTRPAGIAFIEGGQLTAAAPNVMMVVGTTFTSLLAAGGYLSPGAPAQPRVFAVERDRIRRADANSGTFVWSDVRAAGNDWIAPLVFDLTGDGFDDVVAFAPEGTTNMAKICGADIQGATVLTCYDTQFGMDTATLAVGPIAGPSQTDLAILDQPPAGTQQSLFLLRRLRATSGAVLADGMGPPFHLTLTEGHHVVAQLDGGGPEVVVVGRDGRVVCARPTTDTFVACTP
jgi:hypothetical protein